jgi:CRISPR-associated protein Cas5h
MKVLVFDLWGDYGHFRKFYTTSSPLTFSFPPPPTIAGILGAVHGSGKDDYLRVFSPQKCRLALSIVSPAKKVRMGINHINTKDGFWQPVRKKNHEPRTQIRTEFLKDPCFRIYMAHSDESVFNDLCQAVKRHRCVFSVSLGLSELLAGFRFVGICEGEEIRDGASAELLTPVTASNLLDDGLEIESGRKYFSEKMPIKMNPERVIEDYDNVIYEPDGKAIKAKVKSRFRLDNGGTIAFF